MRDRRAERAERWAAFQKMGLAAKADHIYTYYKLPILSGLFAMALLFTAVYHQVTKKEAILYSGCLNVSFGSDLDHHLNTGFLSLAGMDPRKTEVYLYHGLYVSDNPSSENHQYGYASRLKLMASIESKQLDIVLMNREAYDILSQKGYLLDYGSLLSSDEPASRLLEPYLVENTVILEDNAIEYALNEAHRYKAVTEEAVNGMDVSTFPFFQDAGFQEPVYLGVIANSPRLPVVIQYIEYLAAGDGGQLSTDVNL